jgi:hypothetical protein
MEVNIMEGDWTPYKYKKLLNDLDKVYNALGAEGSESSLIRHDLYAKGGREKLTQEEDKEIKNLSEREDDIKEARKRLIELNGHINDAMNELEKYIQLLA